MICKRMKSRFQMQIPVEMTPSSTEGFVGWRGYSKGTRRALITIYIGRQFLDSTRKHLSEKYEGNFAQG